MAEKLYEIRKLFNNGAQIETADVRWLIGEVERLTEILDSARGRIDELETEKGALKEQLALIADGLSERGRDLLRRSLKENDD